MRLHERTIPVQTAEAEFGLVFMDFIKEHDLTYVECLQILAGQQQNLLKYMLRHERHPDDPEKRGDEA